MEALQAEFLRLAREGLAAFPPEDLARLAREAEGYCHESGVVLYCVLGKIASDLAWRWEDVDAVPTTLLTTLDGVLSHALPRVLNEGEGAYVLATALREEIQTILKDSW